MVQSLTAVAQENSTLGREVHGKNPACNLGRHSTAESQTGGPMKGVWAKGKRKEELYSSSNNSSI